jgi:hypothetical protein
MEKNTQRCKVQQRDERIAAVGIRLGFAFAQQQVYTIHQLSAGKRLGDVIIGPEFITTENILILYFRSQ